MTVEGADVAQLRSAAAQFSKGASALETSAKALHSLIGSATQWQGPDADRFRSQWSGQSTRTITAAVEALRQAADTLRRNADEQDKASAVNTSDTAAGRMYDVGQAPKGTEDLFKEILATQNGKRDGVRVQQVVGSDGTTRFIVYLDGTFGGQDMTLLGNGPAAKGYVDPDIYKRINDALAAAGYQPGPNGPEMMLVGYSQGGMDAQTIAATGRYHVTNLVTYGSPLTQADQSGITTLHLRAVGDNVPGMPSELLGGGGNGLGNQIPLDNPGSGPSHSIYTYDPKVSPLHQISLSNPVSLADAAFLGNHADRSTYTEVGSHFDNSSDPRKASIAAFQGDVVQDWKPTPKG
jgi:hypothetical protein